MPSGCSSLRAASVALCLLAGGAVQAAPTVIDFDAVALRGANVGGAMPVITEYANGNGAATSALVAGQKAYYGTTYFGGWGITDISTIAFTYKPVDNGEPYLNLSVTNGSLSGIIAPLTFTKTDNGDGTMSISYDIANATNIRFYEPAPDDASNFNHGQAVSLADLSGWTLLGAPRGLSPLEGGAARGPVDHSLAILWGDSANNYLGGKEIYDVLITAADRSEYTAGTVPEPGSLALVGVSLAGLAALRRRRSH